MITPGQTVANTILESPKKPIESYPEKSQPLLIDP